MPEGCHSAVRWLYIFEGAVQNERVHFPSAPPEAPPGGKVVAPSQAPAGLLDLARGFLKRHGKKLWWLHSAYALALGVGVVLVAQRGFERARWLAVSLGLAWLVLLLFFRLFGSGREQQSVDLAPTKAKIRFYVMTYALKNLYQGMLFFLLPFYARSATLDSINAITLGLLGACAVLSTIDIVFDRVLLKWRVLASLFHGITLFGCLNLVIPALFPDTRTLFTLMWAAGITALAFWTLHVRVSTFKRKRYVALFFASLGASVGLAWMIRPGIPPVPMHVSHSAVGPSTLADGRLAMEVKSLHPSVIQELLAVTDVVVPGGKGDRLHHVWKRNGLEIHRSTEDTSRVDGPLGSVRLRSALKGQELPKDLVGKWTVDVETEDGQLVGRLHFTVQD
ncbi:MAG: DUF2914 domain-containing protein [Myxococcales bacterium]|jgi:hypothetical protein|nr:DUF2914 domain-containing protein [Myxococcales bacterium]